MLAQNEDLTPEEEAFFEQADQLEAFNLGFYYLNQE
jgi:hypothetical protein